MRLWIVVLTGIVILAGIAIYFTWLGIPNSTLLASTCAVGSVALVLTYAAIYAKTRGELKVLEARKRKYMK